MDDALARKRMVDGQLRPNKVTDPRLLAAMAELPRLRFLPAALAARAYSDEAVPLGRGRAMLPPMTLARLVQLTAIRAEDRALVVAAGTGYGAAVLARLGARVVALETDAALRDLARPALAATTAPGTVRLLDAPPAAGWPEAAPYDVILVEGEVPAIPAALSGQLAEGGRLVAIRRLPGRGPAAILGRLAGGAFSLIEQFDCVGPPLPGFAPEPGFVL